MAKLTDGRVIVEVSDEKADYYALMMGYKRVPEPRPAEEDTEEKPIPEPRKPRGRPRKQT